MPDKTTTKRPWRTSNYRSGTYRSILGRLECQGDCIVWTAGKTTAGYGACNLISGKKDYMHRISWRIHNEQEIPPGMTVRHKCDNPPCINPDHLEIGTQLENLRDMFKRKRNSLNQPGSIRPRSVLRTVDMDHLRSIAYDGVALEREAQRLGVSYSYLRDLARGKYVRKKRTALWGAPTEIVEEKRA